MLFARNVYELEEKLRKLGIQHNGIIEDETYFWVKKNGKLMKVLKPMPKEEIEKTLKEGAFPSKYIKAIFSKRLKTEALIKTMKVKDKGVVLLGKAGVGKTFALIFKIAKMLKYYKLKRPLFIPLQSFEMQAYRTVFREYDSYLLDDLNPNLSEWEKDFVREVIYHAYNEEKKVFITSNAEEEGEFMETLKEDPVMSRILGMCEIIQIKQQKDLRVYLS